MRRNIILTAVVAAVLALTLGFGLTELFATDTQPGARSYLLDRGDGPTAVKSRAPTTTAMLWIGSGSPMATPNTFYVPTGMSLPFVGNLFVPGGGPPSSFPTSWLPFAVTWAFGYQFVPTGMAPPAGLLGAVFGPMSPTTGAFGVPMTVMGTGGLLTAMFSPGLPVVAGQSFGIGVPVSPMTRGIGGVATPMAPPLYMFSPMMMGLPLLVPAPPAHWIAGARVTGATVPVELQAFHIE